METITKLGNLEGGYFRILRLFYENKKGRIHLREIARKTKLNENSVTRFLARMVDEKILKFERDANLKRYFLTKNNRAYVILTYFDVERFEKIPFLRKNAIDLFFNALNEKPIIAILFGSTAKGVFNKDSDIDLLLIVNKKIDVKKAESYVDAQTGIRINCLQITYNNFLDELLTNQDKLIASAIETGFPLTNHIKYYEERLK